MREFWLYNRAHNYVDFSMDENGLWVIYMKANSTQIMVSKIEPVINSFDFLT